MAAILTHKDYDSESVFMPSNLLREARRQKNIPACTIPYVCVLDPDGDLTEFLISTDRARKDPCWACYHSRLYRFNLNGTVIGILPCVVGASYAVLVAEQLFVSGCSLLFSITSAGIITESSETKKFALITEAVRDEGTSYHYLPEAVPSKLSGRLADELSRIDDPVWFEAKSWTTDAPYRETETAIHAMKNEGVSCVEMEAAALYALAAKKNLNIICFAHLTNTMAQQEGDFEKGEYFGSMDCLKLIGQITNSNLCESSKIDNSTSFSDRISQEK